MLTALLAAPALLVSPTQGVDSGPASPDAGLHPADATFYWEVPSIHDLPKAYEDSPLWRMVTDPELAKAVSEVSRGQVDLEMLLAMAREQVSLDNLPPELLEMGIGDAIEGMTSLSVSISIADDLEARMAPLTRVVSTMARLEIVGSSVESYTFFGDGSYPSALTDLDVDEELLSDGWGRPMELTIEEDAYRLRSLGADGSEGGAGDAADLSYGSDQSVNDATEEAFGMYLVEVLVESMGLQVVLGFDDETTAESLYGTASMAGQGMPLQPKSWAGADGVEVNALAISEPIGPGLDLDLFLAHHGSHLILAGGGLNGLDAFGSRAKGGFASGLSSNASFASQHAQLPPAGGTTLTRSYAARSWWKVVRSIFDQGIEIAGPLLEASGNQLFGPAELAQLVEQLDALDSFSGMFAPVGAARTDLVDGHFEKHRFTPAGANDQPRWFGVDKIDPSLFGLLPSDAGMVFAAAVDAGSAMQGIESMVTGMLGRPELRGAIADLEKSAQLSLAEDLLAHVDQQMIASVGPVRGIGMPTTLAHAKLRDVQAFEAALGRLLGAVGERYGETVKIKDKPYRKMSLYQLEVQLPEPEEDPLADLPPELAEFGAMLQGMSNTFEMAVGISGDTLVVGLKSLHVKKEMRRLSGDSSRRSKEEDQVPHPLASGAIALPEGVNQVMYADWGGYFAGVYNMGKAFGGLAAGFAEEELPVDLSALPDAELITRHLRPTVSTTVHGPAGSLTHTRSSFGPEMILLPLSSVFGIAAFQAENSLEQASAALESRQDWDLPPPEQTGPVGGGAGGHGSSTRDGLMRLRTVLEVYRYTNGDRYPDALAVLAEATTDFPNGFLDGDAVPVDGWGQAFVYTVADEGRSYRLYSMGANGIDDGGEGDDVPVP